MNLRYRFVDCGKSVVVQYIPTHYTVKMCWATKGNLSCPPTERRRIGQTPLNFPLSDQLRAVRRRSHRHRIRAVQALRCADRRRSRGPRISAVFRQMRLPPCGKTERQQSPGLAPDFFHLRTVRSMTPRFSPPIHLTSSRPRVIINML